MKFLNIIFIQQGQAEIEQAIKDLRGEGEPLSFIVG